ncbi:MAG: glyoxalase [Sphingobacteriales bacterium]|nr:MAG: glyoxalase [Sphingobacteriales bacterium]
MNRINIVSVPVADQQSAKEFYLKMGLEVVTEAPMGNGQDWIQMRFPKGGVDITLVTWFKKMPAGSLHGITILTDDIEADVQDLRAKGIKASDVDTQPWGKFSMVEDIDGNSWVLHQE